jgi:hypothetical protein
MFPDREDKDCSFYQAPNQPHVCLDDKGKRLKAIAFKLML